MADRSREQKRAAIFFTYGMGISEWRDTGLLARRERMYRQYLASFDKLCFVTYDARKEKWLDGITVFGRGKSSNIAWSLKAPFALKEILKQTDILVSVQMMGAWTPVIAKMLTGRRLVLRQGYGWGLFARHAERWLSYAIARTTEFIGLLAADAMIVTAQDQKEHLERINISKTPIHLVPNGIDTRKFRPGRAKKRPKSILFIGKFHEQKNLHNLLRAIAGMDCTLTIVGSGQQEDDLRLLAQELGLKIDWMGRVPNDRLPRLIDRHEVFVLPSHYEGNPKVLLEAMSCGACCVASRVPGNKELIKHGRNGLLCTTSPGSIRTQLKRALSEPGLRTRLGAAARKTITGGFSLDATIRKEIEVLNGQ